MRKLSWVLLSLLVACGSDATPVRPVPVPSEPSTEPSTPPRSSPSAVSMPTDFSGSDDAAAAALSAAGNAFSFSLLKRRPAGNWVLGPGSIYMALAMTWGGARGTTASQFSTVAGFGPATHPAAAGLLREYNAEGSPLALANRLYAEQSYEFVPAFGTLMAGRYGAPMEAVDFRGHSNDVRETINAWVVERTAGRIQDLLPPPSVDESTRLILVNAAYFLGDWLSPFKPEATSPRNFSSREGQDRNVPTMHALEYVPHATIDGARLVELPYEGGRFSMVFVLPETRFGLGELEQSLTQERWAGWLAALQRGPVSLAIPKFELNLDPSLSLVDTLKALGVTDAFDEDIADFTGMAPRLPSGAGLYISDVLHRAFIRVDEAGTEAAAATAVVMAEGAGAPPAEPFEFRADQPFLFFLRDTRSGLIHFMGRVSDPR